MVEVLYINQALKVEKIEKPYGPHTNKKRTSLSEYSDTWDFGVWVKLLWTPAHQSTAAGDHNLALC